MGAYEAAIERYDGLDEEAREGLTPAAVDAVAQAQFMLGEQVFQRFEGVTLEGSEEEVQEGIREKIELGSEATTLYEQVFVYQRPSWAICAFTRLGRLYHVFYEQIIDAPIPGGLTPLEEEAYRTQLEEQADMQKLEAMDRYARAITIARRELVQQLLGRGRGLYGLDPTFKAGTEVGSPPDTTTALLREPLRPRVG